MASTYTSNTGIEKPADGEQSGTWGGTVNDNMDILDRALNGVLSLSLAGTTTTLTTGAGSTSGIGTYGQYRVLVLGGSPSGTNTITVSPNDAQKLYFVKNASGQSAIFTQGSGSTVTIANGASAIIYCDGAGSGAAVVDITSTFNFQPLTATLTAIGTLSVTDGNIIVGDGSTWVAESGATARTSLGLTIGTDVQAYDANLAAIAGLAVTDGNFIVGNGSTWVAESGNTAIASLGITATASELNLLDGSAAGTIVNSKAVVYGASGEVNATTLQIAGTSVTASAAELNYNDITTLGTSQASKVVTADANGDMTLSGEVTFGSAIVETVYTITDGASVDLDPANGTIQVWALGASRSPTASNFAAGESIILMIDDGAANTITWPSVTWRNNGGVAPTLATVGYTVVALWKIGGALYGALVGNGT